MKKHIIALVVLTILILCSSQSHAYKTYYVRSDGGSGTQCTGLGDAAYPGSGLAQACAFNHPFWLLKPNGIGGLSGVAVLQGGDTVVIGPGEYMMGIGAPNSTSCNSAWAYDCTLPAIPSGPDAAHPTTVYGKNWDTKSTHPPQLWGYGRATKILNLAGSNNVTIKYLEITDHSPCIFNNPDASKACNMNSPYTNPIGVTGIYATDSSNVLLQDINIHGMAKEGINAGRLTDWTLNNVIIRANGFGGWDGDVGHGAPGSGTDSSNSGTIRFLNSAITYNGCGENYPSTDIYGCYSQSQGGYGDGLGTYYTGATWIFDNTEISHNTQDGLDMLYHKGPSAGIMTIKNSRFEGNAGNQVKSGTNVNVENSIIIGNCNYFYHNPIAETSGGTFDNCRAMGGAFVVGGWGTTNYLSHLSPGTNQVTMINSVLTGSTTTLIETGGDSCDGTEKFVSRNNIILGMESWQKKQGGEPGYLSNHFYLQGSDGNGTGPCGSGATSIKLDNQNSITYNTRNSACPNATNVLCSDPQLVSVPPLLGANDIYTYGPRWDVTPKSISPAIGKTSSLPGSTVLGSISIPDKDIRGAYRPKASITWGPYEFNSIAPPAAPVGLTIIKK